MLELHMPILHHFPCPSYKLYDAKLPHFDASTSTTTKHYQTNPTTIIPPPKQTPQTKHHHNHHLNQRKKKHKHNVKLHQRRPQQFTVRKFCLKRLIFLHFFPFATRSDHRAIEVTSLKISIFQWCGANKGIYRSFQPFVFYASWAKLLS